MKVRPHIFFFTLALLITVNISGQQDDFQIRLNDLYGRILFTSDDEEKIRLNDSIRMLVHEFASSELVFVKNYPGIRFLGQVTSQDNRIRILTWNLMLRDATNKYFCYIIRKAQRGGTNTIYVLEGSHLKEAAQTDRIYNAGEWYGALYYAVLPSRKDYILLGYDFGDRYSRKIIDVLQFDQDGKILFGKDILFRDANVKYREVLEYSSESVVSLRFGSRKLIVFDQLASFSQGDGSDDGSMGAEGILFDGYEYKKGKWLFKSGIEARNPGK
ncbi:MAG: hypothetical protein JXR66_03325 [Bacteroidales bacterium]|nr:hypothetical protein [Bacteroidales bacterium]